MFFLRNNKKRMEMIQGIRPTSKATLKLQCMFCCRGNIDEATKLYDFFAKDMPNLPDYDPVAPTWIDSTKDVANGLMGWLKENQGTLAQGYEFIRSIIQSKGVLPSLEAPELPPINE